MLPMRMADILIGDDDCLFSLKSLADETSCLIQNTSADTDVVAPFA